MPARINSVSRLNRTGTLSSSLRTSASGRNTSIPPTPASPSSLFITVVDDTHLSISWTNNDSGAGIATGYNLQRATDSGFTLSLTNISIGAGISTYNNSGLTASTTYYYRVRAFNDGGNSSYSASSNALTAPAAPSSLSGISAGSDKIDLTWTDNASDETGFFLSRSTSSDFSSSLTTQSIAANNTTYRNTGLAASTTYYFKLQSVRNSVYSTASNVISVTTDALGVLSLPSIYAPFTHIRFIQAAFSSTPIDSYMDSLLGGTPISGYPNSTSAVLGSQNNVDTHILSINSNVQMSLYTNITNFYSGGVSGLLENWLAYADANSYNRESAFIHNTTIYSFSGSGSTSARAPRWFSGIVRISSSGSVLNTYTQINSTTITSTFGSSVNDYLAIGYLDKFRQIDFTFTTTAAASYAYAIEYPTAVDGSGVPTAWSTLSTLTDTTSGLTTNGSIIWNPPVNWVASSVASSSTCFYWIRIRCTHTGTTPIASAIRAVDYTSSVDNPAGGTYQVFDYASDVGSKGYLTDTEYAGRASGKDAYFAWHTRLNYKTYGTQRYATNPTSAFTSWAQVYYKSLMDSTPSATAMFLDNNALLSANLGLTASGVGTLSTLEDLSTNSTDWFNCLSAVWNNITNGGTRWIWPHSDSNPFGAPAIQANRSSWDESRIKMMKDDWTAVDGLISSYNTVLNLSPSPQFLGIDSNFIPIYGSEDRSNRPYLASLAYFYQIHTPPITAFAMGGGDASVSWQYTWSPCVAFDVGSPISALYPATTTTGNDPAKPSANPSTSTATSGGTISNNTYWLKVSYGTASLCETLPTTSATSITTTGSNTSTITIQSPPTDGLTPGWFIYIGTSSSGPFYRQGTTNTIGTPVTLTSLTLSGTNPIATGQTYKIYSRAFTNAIAYYRPISHTISVVQGTLCDSSAVTVTLPQSMQPLNADGTKGSSVSSFSLRAGEGAIYCF